MSGYWNKNIGVIMWLKASLRHHRQGQTTEGCADRNGVREKMKNEE